MGFGRLPPALVIQSYSWDTSYSRWGGLGRLVMNFLFCLPMLLFLTHQVIINVFGLQPDLSHYTINFVSTISLFPEKVILLIYIKHFKWARQVKTHNICHFDK